MILFIFLDQEVRENGRAPSSVRLTSHAHGGSNNVHGILAPHAPEIYTTEY